MASIFYAPLASICTISDFSFVEDFKSQRALISRLDPFKQK
jgi:hypothetical protein